MTGKENGDRKLKLKRYILLFIMFAWAGGYVCTSAYAQAATDTIRYVKMDGSYNNDGMSWATAKDKVQDAINDLSGYLRSHNLTSGSVYIAAGTYVPTESTEDVGGSLFNTSFKIPAGIHVYGGFNPNSPEEKPGDRIMKNGKKVSENWSDPEGYGTISADSISSQWDLAYKTILTGNHTSTPPTFVYDSVRGRYNTVFPASSYHVVWFATNGKYETGNDSTAGHYKPLDYPASIDGCVITSGSASTQNVQTREHTAYGGGVYMVGNSYMRACTVDSCLATMRGGGIYCDGGGVIEFCYVHTCQATGIGVLEGYGGGICVDYDGQVGHSHITNCAARCGGGLMITHISEEYPETDRDTVISRYSPFTSASVINNNTASAEGGGIYLADGGTVNHATCTGNDCVGQDVTYYGRRHGRTGGIYVRNAGMIFNSVFWGNRCAVNNDIQFASVRQKALPMDPAVDQAEQQVYVYHSAFMNHDISDWTGATKEHVFTLDKSNMPIEGSHGNFPCFFNPTVNPNNWSEHDHEAGTFGPGVFKHLAEIYEDTCCLPGPRVWHLTSYSAIDQKGVQASAGMQGLSPWLIHAHTPYGVVSNPYEPSSTLGGLVRKPDPIVYALVKPQGLEGREGPDKDTPIPTIFVDPKRKGVYEDGHFVPQNKEGNSWTTPIKDLGEAVEYFRKKFVDTDPKNRYYRLPKLSGTGDTICRYVQILVKEGELTTIGPGNYVNHNLRSAAIITYGHMRLYGGYPSSLADIATEGRNPHEYRTVIRANVTGEETARAYENNSAHLFALVNADSVVVDGFNLMDANTIGVNEATQANYGGGVVINNSTIADSLRVNMVGNQFRNCVIGNCTSPQGAGIYVNGAYPRKRDGSIVDTCYAELKVVNTIFRNNKAANAFDATETNQGGIITANGRAFIHLDHCNIVGNVGIPFKGDNINAEDELTPLNRRGYIRVDNSVVYSNGTKNLVDFLLLGTDPSYGNVTSVGKEPEESEHHVFGAYNMFDADLEVRKAEIHHPHGFFEEGYTLTDTTGFAPAEAHFFRIATSAENLPADSAGRHNQCNLTRSIDDANYPVFVNPTRNVGNSPSGDKAMYGGQISYVPMNTNPVVNAANHESWYTEYDNYDRSDTEKRTRGGAPDIGAIENTDLPPEGQVIYVTPNGAGKRDGSSWANAIAGNTVYMVNGIVGPAIATSDSIDAANGARLVHKSDSTPVLTTDSVYNGGWGKSWFTSIKSGAVTETTVTDRWTTEVAHYSGGPRAGERDTIHNKAFSEETRTNTITPGTSPEGFVPGYYDDPRYPYGEISGASRFFWRANPFPSGSYNMNSFINGCKTDGWINNTRAEKYVSGLQWAVEEAARRNHAGTRREGEAYDTLVQVWVGAGKYSDYKGYVMRDSVTVIGGFPVGKYTTPGMNERHALMSTVINIPKAADAEDFDPADYESILQISDTDPKTNSNTFNTEAVKYWDNDLSRDEASDTRTYEYKTRHINKTYTYTTNMTDNTTKYIQLPKFDAGSEMRKSEDVHVDSTEYVYGEYGDKDVWHVLYPSSQEYYEVNISRQTPNLKIYDHDLDTVIGNQSSKCYRIANGSLTGLRMWQTLRNLEDGTHYLTLDMNGGYRNNLDKNFDITTPSNIWLHIRDAAGNELITPVQLRCHGTGGASDRNTSNVRSAAFRKTVQFTTSTTGDVTISIEVGVGTRNTLSNSALFPTDDGSDPDSIPYEYKFDGDAKNNPWSSRNPNKREFFITNLVLKTLDKVQSYGLVDSVATDNDTIVPDSKPDEVIATDVYTVTKERKTVRKRVLTMPDVCVPTYGGGCINNPEGWGEAFSDNLPHTDRVWGESKDKRKATTNTKVEDPHYVEYQEAYWDGFTIRHGFLYNEPMCHGGGPGVNMYEGGHLLNCIVINNIAASDRQKGGGIFCDGATATIEGCFVLNNVSTYGLSSTQGQIFAGGMFLYEGTCFNSLFANNYSYGTGGGVGFCVGKFYNNSIVYNTCVFKEISNKINGGAIALATSSKPNLFVANTIIYGNTGRAIRERTDAKYQGTQIINPFLNCYVQTADDFTQTTYRDNILNYSDYPAGSKKYGKGNVLIQGPATLANTPFAADVEGGYVGYASETNDFRLRITMDSCVNKGTEDFAGDLLDVLMNKEGKSAAKVKEMDIYKSVEDVELPPNDVAFAKRIQDCQIDMGAYEFNAAYNIQPDTTTHPGVAIYYTTYESPGGDASARSPHDAACLQKLQLVLDAAGRYKNALMTDPSYNKGKTGDDIDPFVAKQPNKYWSVEVWLQGDSVNSRTSDDPYAQYTPTRSTKYGSIGYHDNSLDYSFIVPHGIVVKGGFEGGVDGGFYHIENAVNGDTVVDINGNVKVDTTGMTFRYVDHRDPLTFRTVMSGEVVSATGAKGNAYHVLTFTNDLFNLDETRMGDGGQLAGLRDEKDRVVMDGVFLMDGEANSPDEEGTYGGAAIVTDYAHIRNCVIQNNTAQDYGGGLYLKPYALVSGCIIKNNTAETGAGIYVERPTANQSETDSLARVYNSTICENTASYSAGGMWFDNTFVRVNSTALWHNDANDNANVSGTFSRSSSDTDYPFNYCAVESRRLEGQANIELSPSQTEGVRWDETDPFKVILYYPIEMSSTLARAGMTYTEWDSACAKFPTLDTVDIAGIHRAAWVLPGIVRGYAWGEDTLTVKSNDFIDIGARAVNKNYAITVEKAYVLHRLYVMKSELIDSEKARELQDNTSTDSIANVYRQMGSCIYNPFHRLGDAFDYIIAARKSNPAEYRNRVFEVFIEAGTYYPYHNAYGEQDQVRNNTFLVPEAVYVIGGINSQASDHKYGQDGYYDPFTGKRIGRPDKDITIPGTELVINAEELDSIRLRDASHRPMRDYNMNSVIEPWELEHQTILSGNAVSGDNFTHVYHVITMHADSNYVGPQPNMYSSMNPEYGKPGEPMFTGVIDRNDTTAFTSEHALSILGRTVEFDGIQITGGYANMLSPEDTVDHVYVKKTYFRGGGMFIDGLWGPKLDNNTMPNMTEPSSYNIPIIVENCVFNDNMAGNGGGLYSNGGIYMWGCHFTQNYSQGPMDTLDAKFIPWTAGGCIATNAGCYVANTLFDNNEARRGLYPIKVKGADEIPNADARQGFGGVLSIAAQSRTRVVNCHFMKNKAVAYPAIYNFLPNNMYTNPDEKQYAFNTIFWGNESFDVEHLRDLAYNEAPPAESEDAWTKNYYASRKGVFHYDPAFWTVEDGNNMYERLFNEYTSRYDAWVENPSDDAYEGVKEKLDSLRLIGDSIEGMFFCSYRKTYGPSGMKPTKNGYLLLREDTLGTGFIDPRQKPTKTAGPLVERYDSLFSYLEGNNNTLINPINNAIDGPNFRLPTFVAGIDGYMQNADWLLARLNKTTDQGWGHMKQYVYRDTYWLTRYTGTEHYPSAEAALAAANAALSTDTCTNWSIVKRSGMPTASFDSIPANEQDSMSIYNFYAKRYGTFTSALTPPLPLGNQQYMAYTRSTSATEKAGVMNRISMNPRMDVEDVYIDLGIYEYQYVSLDISGQEIDTMWVATKAKAMDRQDGLSFETPTTDLQMAIDMLMSSRNNHDKYICFLGDEDGSIVPVNILDNRLTFLISSNSAQPLLPDSAMADHDYGVNSLNFLGGYSYDVKDAPRDPIGNPTVIEMPKAGEKSQLNQLFVIEDMTRQMTQANWQGEYTSRDSVVIPITFDGITFINPYSEKDIHSDDSISPVQNRNGGAAIYYRWQRRYNAPVGGSNYEPDMDMALSPDSALIDGKKMTLPKLTISNCIFMDNGSREPDTILARSHAVRIDHGGGSSLIVNSLFHSNAGNPVYAQTYTLPKEGTENNLAAVPNDVVIVNSTFALNDGHIKLESDSSQIHNSLIWLDDLMSDTTVQLVMGDDQWDKAANREKAGIEHRMTNNAVWGCFMMAGKDEFGNDSLVTNNGDIQAGPGFLSPHVTARNSSERRERNFRLNPSFVTMNRANDSVYRAHVFYRVYPDISASTHNQYWRRPNGFKSFYITELANDSDLACKPRVSGGGMERGAYECLMEMQRVLYVDLTISAMDERDGSSWGKAFTKGQLQNAIDAAAVYAYMKQGEAIENRMAYVFVKETKGTNPLYNLQARDGVSIFGSIPESFRDTAVADYREGNKSFANAECLRFVNYVRAQVPGVAAANATPTRINSILVSSDEFKTGFIMEGFMITNPGHTEHVSPIFMENSSSVLRNCVITNNTVVDSLPVAQIDYGLLYNCLFYGNNTDTIVRLGARGLALNNTIVVASDTTVALDSRIRPAAAQNNIALRIDTAKCFAPYLTAATPYALPNYLTSNTALSYQLHEHSVYIDAGTVMASLPEALFKDVIDNKVVDFAHDRDVLGNPRTIGSSVDMGALETWRIEKNQCAVLTSLTNAITHEATSDEAKREAFLEHFGGNYYPHPGSVVYLMDSAAMSMDTTTGNFLKYIFNPKGGDKRDTIIMRPGYMLLKPGASFYGNGHKAQFPYVAAEKRFSSQQYSMTAFPFNYDTANITIASYSDAEGTLALSRSPFAFKTYQYNGEARSAKDYVFQENNSSLWLPVDTANRTATDGYLMHFEATMDTVLRFNAFAPEQNKYVYTELGEDDHIVYLTKYDNRTPGTGAGLDFTRQEDMGWNMKGLPWLVSDYRTDTLVDEDYAYLRQMHIPHVLYRMDGDGKYIKDGGHVYSSRSWDRGSYLSMGNAFLTQTATTQAREALHFYLPYYEHNDKKPARYPLLAIARRPDSWLAKGKEDILTLMPDVNADKTVNYTYGRDAVKWMSSTNSAQIYMLDAKRMNRISLLGAAPTEIDIPMGVYIPAANGIGPSPYTFSLPEREAFDGYEYVWLIDYQLNRYVNLLFEDYDVDLEPGEYNHRFAVRIGGYPKTDLNGKRDYVVFAFDGTLYVRGLVEGDRISLYSPSGQLVTHATATTAEWSMPLYYQSGYVVKVNDKAYKVVNK